MLERFFRQGVELSDNLWIVQAILDDCLAVFDRGDVVGSRGDKGRFRHVENKLVFDRHRPQQRIELEIP